MTDFKIGDKVRLTGEGWPKDMLGEVFELYYADSTVGRFRFEALNWYYLATQAYIAGEEPNGRWF